MMKIQRCFSSSADEISDDSPVLHLERFLLGSLLPPAFVRLREKGELQGGSRK